MSEKCICYQDERVDGCPVHDKNGAKRLEEIRKEMREVLGLKSPEERQYIVCAHAVGILAVTCASDPAKIVDMLTGYLWNEEEAGHIKREITKEK